MWHQTSDSHFTELWSILVLFSLSMLQVEADMGASLFCIVYLRSQKEKVPSKIEIPS